MGFKRTSNLHGFQCKNVGKKRETTTLTNTSAPHPLYSARIPSFRYICVITKNGFLGVGTPFSALSCTLVFANSSGYYKSRQCKSRGISEFKRSWGCYYREKAFHTASNTTGCERNYRWYIVVLVSSKVSLGRPCLTRVALI